MIAELPEAQRRRHRHERPAGEVHGHHEGRPYRHERAQSDVAVILGGAALTRRFVEEVCQQEYSGTLFYAKDAFAGLYAMEAIMNGDVPSPGPRQSDKSAAVPVLVTAGATSTDAEPIYRRWAKSVAAKAACRRMIPPIINALAPWMTMYQFLRRRFGALAWWPPWM